MNSGFAWFHANQQVKAYAADMQKAFPHYQIKAYVAYIAGNKACKIFKENSND